MRRFLSRHRALHLWLAILAALFAAYFAMRSDRAAVNFWTRRVAKPVRDALGALCARVPFSVAECLYVLALLALLAFVVLGLRAVLRAQEKGHRVYSLLGGLVASLATVYLLFCLLWGANYYAGGFRAESGLVSAPVSVEELRAAAQYFADQVSAHAGDVPRDEDGVTTTAPDAILAYAPEVYDALYEEFPFLAMPDSVPKAMFFSKIMSATGFTGLYFPFIGESNINVDFPTATMPTTVAHELAHRRGYASEQECNFLGILAAVRTDDPVYNYSGWLSGYIYLSNALYTVSVEDYRAVRDTLDERVRADLRAASAYWERFEGPVEKAATSAYDTLLKGSGESLGVQSYGACVDLLVAYFAPEIE